MGMRFNSFYTDDVHPFVKAMNVALMEGQKRGNRAAFINKYVLRDSQARVEESARIMKGTAKQVIDERKAHPSDKRDVLYNMLYGKDPLTKEAMTEESVMNNMITFLVAGKTHYPDELEIQPSADRVPRPRDYVRAPLLPHLLLRHQPGHVP